MSIQKTDSGQWRVRWRENGRHRSKLVGRKRDAEALDAEIKRSQRIGGALPMEVSTETLAASAEEWWRTYVVPNLAPSTLKTYAICWDLHVLPRVGHLRLRDVTPDACQRLAADLKAAGVVGPHQARRALVLLGGILQRAVEWGKIPANPMRVVRKPSARRERAVGPLAPATVEAIRARLIAAERHGDATLVAVLAYAGLRPGEALALRWSDVRERSILIERAVSDGQVGPTKTRQRRSVRLVGPLRQDLAEWRMRCERPGEDAPILAAHDGEVWREDDWRNWRRRVFATHANSVGVDGSRPYDLRHSATSLWIHEGRSVVEVASWLGHAPTMTLDTYAHVMADMGDERTSAGEAILAARARSAGSVPSVYLGASEGGVS